MQGRFKMASYVGFLEFRFCWSLRSSRLHPRLPLGCLMIGSDQTMLFGAMSTYGAE